MCEYGWSERGYCGPATTGYSAVTVLKSLFGGKLWKVYYRNPPDYPIDEMIHLFGEYYWLKGK